MGKMTLWLFSAACLAAPLCPRPVSAAGAGTGGRKEVEWVRLYGEVGPEAVRLVWEVRRWPERLVGFDVFRRPGAGAGWEKLTSRPILPEVAADKDLSNIESDPVERERLRAEVVEQLRTGTLTAERSSQFRERLAKAAERDFRGLRRQVLGRFDRALVMGFGYVDRQVAAGDAFEYGLVPVFDGRPVAGSIEAAGAGQPRRSLAASIKPSPDDGSAAGVAPAAVFVGAAYTPRDDRLRADDLTVTPGRTGTVLRWTFPEAKVRQASVFGFNVYRAEAGSDRFERVSPGPVGGAAAGADLRAWAFTDRTADAGRPYLYAVAPVNVFDTELATRTVSDGTTAAGWNAGAPASRPIEAVAAPALEGVTELPTKVVRVSWGFEEAEERKIVGFVVERSGGGGRTLAPVSDRLPPTTRAFLDAAPKTHGQSYSYRVTAVGAGANLAQASAQQNLVFIDLPPPPKPLELKARWVTIREKHFIEATWADHGDRDRLTRGYRVYADTAKPGELSGQNGAGIVAGSECFLEMNNPRDRTVRVAVAGLGEIGDEGPRADVTCLAPGVAIPAPTGVAVARAPRPGAPVEVRWQYPDSADVRGFRIYEHDRLVVDEATVAGKARSWSDSAPAPGKSYAFAVAAVSGAGVASDPSVAPAYEVRPLREETTPTPPTGLGATWLADGGRTRVRLHWDAAPAGPIVKQYVTDFNVSSGDHPGRGDAPLVTVNSGAPNEVVVTPPSDRQGYTFRLRAVGAGGEESAASEVQIPSPEGLLDPPVLLDFRVVDEGANRKLRWVWRYPQTATLKGFRLYENGKRVADESAVAATDRAWTTGPLPPNAAQTFEIEAVAINGEASARGPAQQYTFVKPPDPAPAGGHP